MFRACLIQPLRAGRQRKFSARKHWERLLTEWKAGNWQEVWDQAVEIERQRHFKRRGRKPAKKPVRQTREEQAYRRAKNLVSMDELSKAISALMSHDVAPMTDSIVRQLKAKHPPRRAQTSWPSEDAIRHERAANKPEDEVADTLVPPELRKTANIASREWPSLQIDAKAIEAAASKARRTTTGGLQQITPWHLRQAIEADTNRHLARLLARLCTRWGRGDYATSVGTVERSKEQ